MDQIRVPIEDDKGSIIKNRFENFLRNYGIENPFTTNVDEVTQQMFVLLFSLYFLHYYSMYSGFRVLDNYMLQITFMMEWNKSTVFVNFAHLYEVSLSYSPLFLIVYSSMMRK
jgi:hypothetical protein